jgi:hypothetical protein
VGVHGSSRTAAGSGVGGEDVDGSVSWCGQARHVDGGEGAELSARHAPKLPCGVELQNGDIGLQVSAWLS